MGDGFPAIDRFDNISCSLYHLKNIHFTLDMNHLLKPASAHLMRRQQFQGKILGGWRVHTQDPWEVFSLMHQMHFN